MLHFLSLLASKIVVSGVYLFIICSCFPFFPLRRLPCLVKASRGFQQQNAPSQRGGRRTRLHAASVSSNKHQNEIL